MLCDNPSEPIILPLAGFESGLHVAEFSPSLFAVYGTRPKFGPFRSDLDRGRFWGPNLADVGRIRPKFGRHRLLIFADRIELGPTFTNSGQDLPDTGVNMVKIGPSLFRLGHILPSWPELGRTRPTLAEFGPSLAGPNLMRSTELSGGHFLRSIITFSDVSEVVLLLLQHW